MKRDFRSCMLLAVFGLPIFLLLFIAFLYVGNCGFSVDCSQASLPAILHTPIPTLIPASLPAQGEARPTGAPGHCLIPARTLLSAWVNAGYSETQTFIYQDINGNYCQATFANVMPLFNQPNLWYAGALACNACHNAVVAKSAANLDLSSYAGILAGAKRASTATQGEDILGGGDWEKSQLYKILFVDQLMPFGHPPRAIAAEGPTIQAGMLFTLPTPEATEGATQEEVARPSNTGGTGNSINLKGDSTAGEKVYADHCQVCHGPDGTDNVLNPGSDDGTIPPLNPIDSTLVSPDYKTFAYNLDLFLQNGSMPEGPNAVFQMPAWGAKGALTQQQIADVIAYIISINK